MGYALRAIWRFEGVKAVLGGTNKLIVWEI